MCSGEATSQPLKENVSKNIDQKYAMKLFSNVLSLNVKKVWVENWVIFLGDV